MPTQREMFDTWFANRKNRASELEAIEDLRAVASLCDAAIARGTLTEQDIAALVTAASHRLAILWNNTTDLIKTLQMHGIDTAAIVRALFASKRAKIRLRALFCVKGDATPTTLLDDMLLLGLADKDTSVCWHAAQIATIYFRKRWLVPHMEAAAQKSKGIAYYQQLLRDGFVANQLRDGSYWVEVLTQANGVRRADITEEEVEANGLASVVAHLQQCEPGEVPILVEEERLSDASVPK